MDQEKITSTRTLRIAMLAMPLLVAGALGVACGQSHKDQPQAKDQGHPATGTQKQALAVHALGLFEIDDPANTNNEVGTGDDWQNTIGEAAQGGTQTSSALQKVRVADGASNATIFTGGGSKDEQPLNKWKWKDGSGGLPDKDNIVNAYAAAYTDPSTGHLILYFGADRYATDGDAQMGFWFFRDDVHFVPDPSTADGGGFSGTHQDGDLLVLVNFLKGGTENHIQVFKWQAGAVVQVTPEAVSNLERVCNPASAGFAAGIACASTNKTSAVTAYWPYETKGTEGLSTSIPPLGFVEGGIDATALSGINCVSSFSAETRSSQSITATLKDVALGSFPTCSLSVTKNCTGTTLSTVSVADGGTAIVPSIGYGFQVCNNGVGTVNNVMVTDQMPGQPPVVTNIGSLNGGQCYDGGTSYVPSAVDDGGTTPCTATFTNSVSASATFGETGVIEAGPATATCPLCPCNAGGGGDAGTGG
jgi:hypothetical protein